jgi:DNA-directed RNA polymerase subunit RPC12/RpoP
VANYVCPNCGQNNAISEISLAWVEYRGQLDENGVVTMFDTEEPVINDNPDDPCTHYFCEDCRENFDVPVTTEEYETEHKN